MCQPIGYTYEVKMNYSGDLFRLRKSAMSPTTPSLQYIFILKKKCSPSLPTVAQLFQPWPLKIGFMARRQAVEQDHKEGRVPFDGQGWCDHTKQRCSMVSRSEPDACCCCFAYESGPDVDRVRSSADVY